MVLLLVIAGLLFGQDVPERSDIDAYRQKANGAYILGDFKTAEDSLRLVLQKLPRDSKARIVLALTLQGEQRFKEAETLWKNLYHESKNDPSLGAALGRNYFYQGKFKEAGTLWSRYLPKIKDSPRAAGGPPGPRLAFDFFLLALDQYFMGSYQDSLSTLEYLQKSLKVEGAFIGTLRGDDWVALKDPHRAIDAYREALSLDPAQAELRRRVSQMMAEYGDFDNAYIEARRYYNQEEDKGFESQMKEIAKATSKPEEVLLQAKETSFEVAWPKKVDYFVSKKSPPVRIGLFANTIGDIRQARETNITADSPFAVTFEDNSSTLWLSSQDVLSVTFVESPVAALSVAKKGDRPTLTAKGILLKSQNTRSPSFLIKGTKLADLNSVTQAPMQVRGQLAMVPKTRGFLLINALDMEEYLLGVLPTEIGTLVSKEAIKTQAVLARTYGYWRATVDQVHKKRGDFCDLCDNVHCQAYRGFLSEHTSAQEALEDTFGEVLRDQDTTPRIWYHAGCGGVLADSASWDEPARDPVALLNLAPGQFLEFFQFAPFLNESAQWCFEKKSRFAWVRRVSIEEMSRKVNQMYPNVGKLLKVNILSRGGNWRVNKIELVGDSGRQIVEEDYLIRKVLAPGALRSALFDMEPITKDGQWKSVLFFGRGYGHGRGLCQVGAINQAAKGVSYKEILKFYYPKYDLKKQY